MIIMKIWNCMKIPLNHLRCWWWWWGWLNHDVWFCQLGFIPHTIDAMTDPMTYCRVTLLRCLYECDLQLTLTLATNTRARARIMLLPPAIPWYSYKIHFQSDWFLPKMNIPNVDFCGFGLIENESTLKFSWCWPTHKVGERHWDTTAPSTQLELKCDSPPP